MEDYFKNYFTPLHCASKNARDIILITKIPFAIVIKKLTVNKKYSNNLSLFNNGLIQLILDNDTTESGVKKLCNFTTKNF